jgi:predicted phage terminase large subunit-like protein
VDSDLASKLLTPLSLANWSSGGRYRIAPHLVYLEQEVMQTLFGPWDVLVAMAPPRHGKLCAHSEPVWTPDGWVLHGDLRPGDRVYSPDGSVVRVLAVGNDGFADRSVRFNDGSEVLCHSRHEWPVYDRGRRRGGKRLVETEEMRMKTHMGRLRNGDPRNRFVLDYPEPLKGVEASLEVDPYVLGVWLGDGRSTAADICGDLFDLTVIEGIIASRGYRLGWQTVHRDTGVCYRGIKGLRGGLRRIGVLGNKHIPVEYLTASVVQRRDLLRGLIDTDGSVEPGGRVRFVSCELNLISGVVDLVRSLGYRASVTEAKPAISTSGVAGRRVTYTVQWTPHDGELQAYLPRKQILRCGKRRRFTVASVEVIDPVPGRCIQVEGGEYLVGKSMVPTHNSQFLSRRLMSWLHNVYPAKPSIVSSYSVSLARNHSRWVRDNVHNLRGYFGHEGVSLADGAASDWSMQGFDDSGMLAAGVGGGITGRGAAVGVIDDPLKNAEQALSERIRSNQWEWFESTFLTRIEPGGKVLVLLCLVGDTEVSVPGGSKKIRDVRPGDVVESFKDGRLCKAKVSNHTCVGHDEVFTLSTALGNTVTGNERHPFLVAADGGFKWVRLRDLRPGDLLVASSKAAKTLSWRERCAAGTTSNFLGKRLKGNALTQIESTTAPASPKGAGSLLSAWGSALLATARTGGPGVLLRSQAGSSTEGCGSSIDTGLPPKNSTICLPSKMESALFAASHQMNGTLQLGDLGFASTTATRRGEFEGFCAMRAISQRDTLERLSVPLHSLDTSDFTVTEVTKVEPAGTEFVYDIEVEETGNFIANGVVTHNTRWHADDLGGLILRAGAEDLGLRVRECRLPALSEGEGDPLGRPVDAPLWPDQWPYEYLARRRDTLEPYWWNALYQQRLGSHGRNEWPESYFYGIYAQDDEWPANMALSATALDPSLGKNASKGDYSAVVNVGFSGGYLWVDADLKRRPVPEMMADLLAFNSQVRPTVTGVEAVAFQEVLAESYVALQHETGDYRDDPVLIDNTVNKELRIRRLGFWLRAHRLKVRRNASGQMLVKQLKEFPNSKHDDGPDALEMAVRLMLNLSEDLTELYEGPDNLRLNLG